MQNDTKKGVRGSNPHASKSFTVALKKNALTLRGVIA